ncbi:hypothetical protein [Saccharothrix coeruleofusca]|uniref:Uncharacterized protein n=1 Tax=Saccharothrix coeruleofusca TaxID=33919 RepID=A0A918EG47_9PSEU|nr:hypothetical protein [Saccharothrix coeruleofusca]MBP2336735.1 hypothetical protein [Saccharothrix coeruleofusca]GGP78424.1 hypothetical protein GCM10010185_60220 [Saccharothrix coeruleofusca]
MTPDGRPNRSRGAAADFAETRSAAQRAEAARQIRAGRTVANHSLDANDRRELLSMLGLPGADPDTAPHDRHVPA